MNLYTTCEQKVPVIHVNRFHNQFFLMSVLSKVIFGFSAVLAQNTVTICGSNNVL